MIQTTNITCIAANAQLLALRRAGTWNGVQESTLTLKTFKNGKVKTNLVSSSWFKGAAEVRDLKRTHSFVPSGAPAYYKGMDDFGTAFYTLVKPI